MKDEFAVLKVEGSVTSLEFVCDGEDNARSVAKNIAESSKGKTEVMVYRRLLKLEARPNVVVVEG